MQATKTMTVPGSTRRLRMAAELLWFASVSFAVGLLAAVGAAVLVMLLAQPAYASRPVPRLVAPAAETPIVLLRLKIDSVIRDSVARTTVEMVFYNPNRRQLEGELQFPLLDGQQVTAFALDIDGKLRDAVVVEKSRGQQVFEDISRQRIDPGLLQVTEGNNFKVRVYPIFANGTRTVSITYIENLAIRGTQGIYRLPLEYGSTVGVFAMQLSVRGAGSSPRIAGTAARDLVFARDDKSKLLKTHRLNYAPRGILEIGVKLAPGPRIVTQRVDSRDYFYAEVPVQARKVKRALPDTIGLIWDSSGSGAARDHARELALLDAYFKAVNAAEVHLVRVRDTVENAGAFKIVGGRWQALREALEQTVYDGATNLGAFVPDPRVKEYLLFSDGLANYGGGAFPHVPVPLHAISASAQANPAWLKHVAHRSGGSYLDVLAETPEVLAGRMEFAFERVRSIGATGAAQLLSPSPDVANGKLAVTGILTEPVADIRVELGLPGRRPRTVAWRVDRKSSERTVAASFWARERIAELEADYAGNRAEILRLGRAFGLVTRETSLIVLETVQDYVRFDIQPPAELIASYERERQRMGRIQRPDREQKIERVVAMLNDKAAWWRTDFSKGPLPIAVPQSRPSGALASRGAESTPQRRDGYLTDSQGAIVRGGDSGVCVRTEQWSPAVSAAECDPDLVAKSAPPPPPARASAPMAKPAAKPMAKPKPMLADASPQSSAALLPARRWSPDAPYRSRFAIAEGPDLYRMYLDERPNYSTDPAFYIDVADYLIAKGQRPLALRVLSNLAEINLEDRYALRALAQRLLQEGEHRLAVSTNRRIVQISPEEPQSFRDLGLALAFAGDTQQAVDSLYEVIVRPWHERFPEIELVTLADLNAIVANTKAALDVSRIDPRLLRNMPVDLRVVLTWDADNTNVDLQVVDPNGQSAYGGGTTFQGGRMSRNFMGGYGPEEFSLRVAKPGTYRVVARFSGQQRQVVGAGPVYAHAYVYTKFGSRDQAVRAYNVMLSRVGSQRTITEITIPDKDDH